MEAGPTTDEVPLVLQRLSDNENLAVGLAAGLQEQVLVQPLVFWKNSVQQRLPLTVDPRIVFRGTGAACCSNAAITGIQFQFAGVAQKLFTGGVQRPLSPREEVVAGFAGGAVSGPACSFFELTMIQQQRFGGSLIGTPVRIAQGFGVGGLLRGITASTGREGAFAAGYLGILPVIKRQVADIGIGPWAGSFIGAVCAGLIGGAVTQPLDTIKTCMQGDLERKTYTSFSGTLRRLHAESGVRGLYRGYWWRSAVVVVDYIVLHKLMELLAPVMFPHHFAEE